MSSATRLTKRVVDAAALRKARWTLWDNELKGFGVEISRTGTKTYFVRYRPKGLGRDGPKRFYRIGRHGELTTEQARDLARALLGQVASGVDPVAKHRARRDTIATSQSAMNFEDACQLFLSEHVSVKRVERTAASYESILRLYAKPRLGRRPLAEITRADIAKLHLDMRDTPHSANRLVAVISSLYSFAAKRGLVPEGTNPAWGIEKFKEEGRERYLTSNELKRLGDVLEEAETIGLPWTVDRSKPTSKHIAKGDNRQVLDRHGLAAIRLLLFTGARLREILDLRWEHVDLDRGLLFLPRSKTGKKTIVLSGAASQLLVGLLESRSTSPFVIEGRVTDQPRADLKKPWAAIRRRAGLEGVRLHDLRHTYASIGAGASLGLPIVGKLLGHSQPQTTARYAHLDADPLRRAANLIGDEIVTAMGRKSTSD